MEKLKIYSMDNGEIYEDHESWIILAKNEQHAIDLFKAKYKIAKVLDIIPNEDCDIPAWNFVFERHSDYVWRSEYTLCLLSEEIKEGIYQ